MVEQRKTILIKLTGEIFSGGGENQENSQLIVHQVVDQIARLQKEYQLGIVIGGGNYFRGKKEGARLGLTPWHAHLIGMFATVMNGLALADLLEKKGVQTAVFCALECAQAGKSINPESVRSAVDEKRCLVFSGGTGNPFFTTDTNAVLRALEIGAQTIWKAGPANGVYDSDPVKNKSARLIQDITYARALELKLQIMDMSALALAAEHKINTRVFNVFEKDAITKAAENPQFGSLIHG